MAELQLVDRLRADLVAASKAHDRARVTTVRTMISALDNATAVEVDPSFVPLQGRTADVPRKELTDVEQLAILRVEAEGRRSAMQRYEEIGKADEATRLRAELAVFAEYLDPVPGA